MVADIVQVGIGYDDHGDGLHFQPPPERAARAPEAEARAESK